MSRLVGCSKSQSARNGSELQSYLVRSDAGLLQRLADAVKHDHFRLLASLGHRDIRWQLLQSCTSRTQPASAPDISDLALCDSATIDNVRMPIGILQIPTKAPDMFDTALDIPFG